MKPRTTFDDDDDRFRPEPSAEPCSWCTYAVGHADGCPQPAPSAEPKMPETDHILTLMRELNAHWSLSHSDITWALHRAGLAIVPVADVVTAEERRVLEDVVRIVSDWIDESDEQDPDISMQQIETVACVQVAVELARRAAKACPNDPCDPECPGHD